MNAIKAEQLTEPKIKIEDESDNIKIEDDSDNIKIEDESDASSSENNLQTFTDKPVPTLVNYKLTTRTNLANGYALKTSITKRTLLVKYPSYVQLHQQLRQTAYNTFKNLTETPQIKVIDDGFPMTLNPARWEHGVKQGVVLTVEWHDKAKACG